MDYLTCKNCGNDNRWRNMRNNGDTTSIDCDTCGATHTTSGPTKIREIVGGFRLDANR